MAKINLSLIVNQPVYAFAGTRLRFTPSVKGNIVHTYNKNDLIGYLTNDSGDARLTADGNFQWFPIHDSTQAHIGYVRNDVCEVYTKDLPPKTQVNIMINELLNNDITIAGRIMICAEILDRCSKAGQDVTGLQQQLSAYNSRLTARQTLIQQNPTVLAINTTMIDTVDKTNFLIKNWMNPVALAVGPVNGLGLGPAAIVVIVCAVAVALVATYAIVAKIYGPAYDEGKVDMATLPNLQKLIAKADPATAAAVNNEIQALHDKTAKNQAKKDANAPDNTLRNVAIAAGLAFVAVPLVKAVNEPKPAKKQIAKR